ncbi:hypothetical protein GNP80_19965 [Aliivibrio fischeri]|nr:hypothetical protein [Aliivibrio fischeri]MUK94689.1 hypothetical protein [Aliivibrio fischeri]
MITFTTNPKKNQSYEFQAVRFKALLLLSSEGQYLARFDAPKTGWTHQILCNINTLFNNAWHYCGVDAYLGELQVGYFEADK